MTLLEQCQIWNEKDEYQKIIDTIEAIPEESRTPELCSELARAYNNAADVDDKEMYEKALSLLLPYEEHFQGITTGISVWAMPITTWIRRDRPCAISSRLWKPVPVMRTPSR